jgi:hypothetical protein
MAMRHCNYSHLQIFANYTPKNQRGQVFSSREKGLRPYGAMEGPESLPLPPVN